MQKILLPKVGKLRLRENKKKGEKDVVFSSEYVVEPNLRKNIDR